LLRKFDVAHECERTPRGSDRAPPGPPRARTRSACRLARGLASRSPTSCNLFLRAPLVAQVSWVQSPVRTIWSHVPCGAASRALQGRQWRGAPRRWRDSFLCRPRHRIGGVDPRRRAARRCVATRRAQRSRPCRISGSSVPASTRLVRLPSRPRRGRQNRPRRHPPAALRLSCRHRSWARHPRSRRRVPGIPPLPPILPAWPWLPSPPSPPLADVSVQPVSVSAPASDTSAMDARPAWPPPWTPPQRLSRLQCRQGPRSSWRSGIGVAHGEGGDCCAPVAAPRDRFSRTTASRR
jgi:hypothetical protein